ncbi:hypothetical protein KS4_20720 [Poriferisphaera corsica]|uniref:N-acetyltransferase domain-containing protein n=1 Tax=Poriferisphaera corsica TaxID=2528020 RepID=A0A517YUW9_9BACT|nr:hypothetical protein [Poriferisphaera corsica]QDU34011.1 hypothetical protein KS4_20720 [Poriferisphaera corsica]
MKLSKQLKVRPVIANNHHIWLNLAQSYEAELSPYTSKLPDLNGLFQLDSDINNQNDGYLLYQGMTPIGFSIVTKTNASNFDIREFYVCPYARNRNIGKWFAHTLFDMYSGNWHVKQIDGYDKATLFWQSVIREYTGNNYSQHKLSDAYWGRVIEQRFENPSHDADSHSLDQSQKDRRLSIPRWSPHDLPRR